MLERVQALAGLFVARSSSAAHIAADKTRAQTVAGPLDIEAVNQHVHGWRRIGAIPYLDDGRILWACIDFDVAHWPEPMEPDSAEAQQVVHRVETQLSQSGYVPFIERSKSKGWHIWVLWAERVDAGVARHALRHHAVSAGVPEPVTALADFLCPRSDTPRGVGNGTWLPLHGTDEKAGAATRFHRWQGGRYTPCEDQEAVLEMMRTVPSAPPQQPLSEGEQPRVKLGAGWIVRELSSHGLHLENVSVLDDRVRHMCPLHESSEENQQSAVTYVEGNGHCSSARCSRKWRSLRELLVLSGIRPPAMNGHDTTPPTPDLLGASATSRPLSLAEPERVCWLWDRRIPIGKITVLDGDPGSAKSLLSLDLAARVSLGREMPDGTPCGTSPAAALIVNVEDEDGDTLRPRLSVLEADLSRIHTMRRTASGGLISLPDDLPAIRAEIVRLTARLLVLDPLMGILAGKVDAHRDQDVRAALAQVADMAAETDCAVLLVRHLNKGAGGNALYRGGGSIGIVAAARSGLIVLSDPDEPGVRILTPTKANLSEPAGALRYAVRGVDTAWGPQPRIEWLGAAKGNTQELYEAAQLDRDERSAAREARDFLAARLRGGAPVEVREIQREARARGISERTLERTRRMLGVVAAKQQFSGKWVLSLPQ